MTLEKHRSTFYRFIDVKKVLQGDKDENPFEDEIEISQIHPSCKLHHLKNTNGVCITENEQGLVNRAQLLVAIHSLHGITIQNFDESCQKII